MIKINKRTLKNFTGLDVSIIECFENGYIFKIKNTIIHCFYNPENNKYMLDYIHMDADFNNEINNDFLNMREKKDILNYTGMSESDFLESDILNKVSDIQSYNSWYFNSYSEYTKKELVAFLNKLGA